MIIFHVLIRCRFNIIRGHHVQCSLCVRYLSMKMNLWFGVRQIDHECILSLPKPPKMMQKYYQIMHIKVTLVNITIYYVLNHDI